MYGFTICMYITVPKYSAVVGICLYVCVCVCVYSIYTCVSAMHWRADREKKMKFVNIWRANCRYSFPG